MFYLCSIGSNIDPHTHLSVALGELDACVGPLQLSSVIRTKPVAMDSCHDFLNCLLILESSLDPASLKQIFVALEIAHGRDRRDPLCKVRDRPLDIDILATTPDADFSSTPVDAYLIELLAELFGYGEVHDPKVALRVQPAPRVGCTRTAQRVGLWPVLLDTRDPLGTGATLDRHGGQSESGQPATTIDLDAGPRHVTVPHQ